MARKIVETMTDDVDGGPADETVTITIDGRTTELDLSAANAEKLRVAVAAWTVNGRVTKSAKPGGKATRRADAGQAKTNGDIREWAAANGHVISQRGRIPVHVRRAYAAARDVVAVEVPSVVDVVEGAQVAD